MKKRKVFITVIVLLIIVDCLLTAHALGYSNNKEVVDMACCCTWSYLGESEYEDCINICPYIFDDSIACPGGGPCMDGEPLFTFLYAVHEMCSYLEEQPFCVFWRNTPPYGYWYSNFYQEPCAVLDNNNK